MPLFSGRAIGPVRCISLHFGTGNEENQSLRPDLFSPRARLGNSLLNAKKFSVSREINLRQKNLVGPRPSLLDSREPDRRDAMPETNDIFEIMSTMRAMRRLKP